MESRIETSDTTSDNSWKVATGAMSPILMFGGLMALVYSFGVDEPASRDKFEKGAVIGLGLLALGTAGLVFSIAF